MSKKIKDEQKKFLGETLNQYDKALNEGINQLDKKNREQNHKISSLVNSFDNEYLEKDVEGNMTALENSKDGMVIINEIQGNTEVNYCKDGEKELILNGDIDTQGESFVTLTEGVDGGLVDVSLEGNTEINLSKTKDPVLVTREFDDINCNAGKLQYTIDDVTTINDEPGKVDIDRIVGDTMVNHTVNGSEELILNAHINESGDNNITLNGVTSDGGKVDVALEGNTLVNVSNVKDDYITPTIEDKVDQGSVISLPEVSEGYVNVDSIEGNTLVNYCTDGSKEMTLNGDIDVEGVSVTTTEGVDNGKVDVMCEGNTLVNLCPLPYVNGNYNSNPIVTNETITITLEDSYKFRNSNLKQKLIKGKTYTVIGKILENNMNVSTIGFAPIDQNGIGGNGATVYFKPNQTGIFEIQITPTIEDSDVLRFLKSNTTEGIDETRKIVIENKLVVLEGNYTGQGLQYFEGIKSVGQDDTNGHKIEIVSQNKNLIDPSKVVKDKSIDQQTGEVFDTSSSYALVDYVPIQPNKPLRYSVTKVGTENNSMNGTMFHFYDINKKHIYSCWILELLDPEINGKTPSNAYYLRISYGINDGWGTSYETLLTGQLEYGTTVTDYIPHQSNKKEILLTEPLRSLPNGTKDRFVKIGGKWFVERNCAELVVNTSMQGFSFQYWNGTFDTDNLYAFYLYNGELFGTNPNGLKYRDGRPIICDKFPYIPGGTTSTASGVWSGLVSSPPYIGFKLPKNIIDNCEGGSVLEKGRNYLKSIGDMKFIVEYINPIYEPLEIEPTLNTYNDTTHISNNSIIPCNMQIKNTGYNAIIKPSTLYTVAVDTDKNGEIGMNLGGTEVTTTNNVATITTPSTLTDDSLRLYGKGVEGSKIRLLEGDKTNWIPSFFEGMQSSFEDKVQTDGTYKMEILMSNENLLDVVNDSWEIIGSVGLIEKIGSDITFDCNGSTTGAYGVKMSEYMYLKPNTQYVFNADWEILRGTTDLESPFLRISFPMTNTSLSIKSIDGLNFTTDVTGIVKPMLYVDFPSRNDIKVKFTNIQLKEVGNADYVPHKHNKIQLSSIEPLRSVGNAKDRIVFKDNKLMIERNCDTVIFNGTENWGLYSRNPSVTFIDTISFQSGFTISNTSQMDNTNLICNLLPNRNFYGRDVEGIFEKQSFRVSINKGKLSSPDVDGWKEYLSKNNMVVVYPLEIPTYEEIPYDLQKIILESYANGTLFFDTNIPPTKVSFNCFEEELTYLYPATSYTVQFVSDRAIAVDITLGGTQLLAQNIVKGLNRIAITTPTTLIDNKLIIDSAGAKISKVVVTDTDREFKYFEGMKSVGECEDLEVVISNKNLFDINIFNDINNFKNCQSNISWGYHPIFIGIGNKAYLKRKYKDNITNYPMCLLCNDKHEGMNKTWLPISHGSYRDTNYSGNISADSDGYVYILITLSNISQYKNILDEVIISITDSDYIPHAHNNQQLTHEPLRAVGNAKDRYVIVDGKWYIERNCGYRNSYSILEEYTNDDLTNRGLKLIKINQDIEEMNASYVFRKAKSNKFKCVQYNYINNGFNEPFMAYISPDGHLWVSADINYTQQDMLNYISDCQFIYELPSPQYEPINYNPLEVYSDVTHITTNSTIPTNITVKNHGYNMVALKENTQYTLYVNKDTTNALTYRLGDYVEINSPSKFTFTTPETLTDKTLRIDGKGAKVNDLMLIEGTPINDSIGYFDGLKSSYECEQVTDENDENYGKYKVDVKVVGKNLFNKDTVIVGKYQNCSVPNKNFKITSNPNYNITDFVPVKPNTQYIISGTDMKYHAYYDKDKNPITTIATFSTSFITPSNAYYMIFNLKNIDDLNKVQIEEGDIVTEYEPYFESKQTIYLNSPLLKGDEIVWKDNKIQHYHKMNRVVLDGREDEDWRYFNNTIVAKNNTIDFYILNYPGIHNSKVISNKFITNNTGTTYMNDKESISGMGGSGLNIWLSINKLRLKTQNVIGLKQWLQQNPITVVYELETPYYEEISDYPLKLNVIANSSLSTESTIQVTNISFNIYEETLPYLYPNTKYYITFNADVNRNNIVIDLGGNHVVFDCKVGFNKVEITTPSDTTNLLTFSGTGVNIDHVKVTQQDIDKYFEGMKSVGECEGNVIEILSRNSKNLIDIIPSNWEVGTIDGNNGQNVDSTIRIRTNNFMLLPKKQDYLYHKRFGNYKLAIRFYDKDYKMINGANTPYEGFINQNKISIPNGAFYYKLVCASIEEVNILPNEIVNNQCYLGTEKIPTSYIEPKLNKQQLSHEPLRKVGESKDRYVIIDGKWYIERNCMKFTFNGSENGRWTDTGYGGHETRNTFEIGIIVPRYPNALKSICDTYITEEVNDIPINDNAYRIGNTVGTNSSTYFFLFTPSTSIIPYRDLDAWREWLSENPITIIVECSPYYEPIDYNPFEVYEDTTHITANSLIPTNVVVKNHGYNCILKPSTKYTIALNKPNGTISAKLGGSEKVDSTNSIFTITTPSTLNDNVLRLSGSGNVKDIMILEGDKTVNTPSYFEGIESVFEQEYDEEKDKYRVTIRVEGNGKESSIIFYIDKPLRGTGTAKDKVFIKDGKVVVQRNCGSLVLDGTAPNRLTGVNPGGYHTWTNSTGNTVNGYVYFNELIEGLEKKMIPNSKINCNTLPSNRGGHINVVEGIILTTNYFGFSIHKAKLGVTDVNDQQQNESKASEWFKNNPVTVVYQLAEPVYEEAECDLSKLVLENYENSSLIFKSNIPVSANIKYSGEVPVVTQAKALSSKVDNTTLDINENIIPYMCDIDYRIVELQLMNGDTQGEDIELLGIGDIEILGNENVLFNNREDKKHNFSYDMLKRDILSQRYSKEEYQYRLDRYLLANKISDEEYKELEGLLNNGK